MILGKVRTFLDIWGLFRFMLFILAKMTLVWVCFTEYTAFALSLKIELSLLLLPYYRVLYSIWFCESYSFQHFYCSLQLPYSVISMLFCYVSNASQCVKVDQATWNTTLFSVCNFGVPCFWLLSYLQNVHFFIHLVSAVSWTWWYYSVQTLHLT